MLARFKISYLKKYSVIVILLGFVWLFLSINSYYGERVDWNDYKQVSYEALIHGFGERGEGGKITDPDLMKYNQELFDTFGMSVAVSDIISVNRTIPDYRHKDCLEKRYLRHLPQVSIIIIFNNEVLSVFQRTLHSLYNRTPHHLIKEVILVNDNSTLLNLYKPLNDYINQNFPNLKFIRIDLKERTGIVKTRTTGAKAATSDYLFLMEPHMELGHNWLPPLLEPVYLQEKTVTVPILDFIEYTELRHNPNFPSRGMFDWNLEYRQLPRLPHKEEDEMTPYPIPVMTGGVFLIRKDYFFELGPYDEGLLIWGSENLEMSFKLNLCGGKLIEVPCSRMGHLYREFNKFRKHPSKENFQLYNKKRVAEVWMDEYKQYFYDRVPFINQTDPGDLSKPKALKEKLNCKPFKYFMEKLVPDINDHFPPVTYNFANGTISLLNTDFCLDTYSRPLGESLGLYECEPGADFTQYFYLSWFRDIRVKYPEVCFDAHKSAISMCHYGFGNQLFKYDLASHQIICLGNNKCLEGHLTDKSVNFTECDKSKMSQKWKWSHLNLTALMSWDTYGKKLNNRT